jgi:uncharacterized membrane protein (UPF0127 family)
MAACGGDAATQIAPPTVTIAPTAAPTAAPVSTVAPAEPTIAPTPVNTPTSVPPTPTEPPPSSPPPSDTTPTVTIGGASFTVDLADTPEKRFQGLSGREVLEEGTGMLFVFQEERQHTFWMKDMRFPLDMIWITAECAIADIIADVPNPPPDQIDGVLPTYSPSAPGTFVLELNAGVAASSGLQTGDQMSLSGSLTGRFGC